MKKQEDTKGASVGEQLAKSSDTSKLNTSLKG